MLIGLWRAVAVASMLVAVAACSRSVEPDTAVTIRLTTPPAPATAYVEVTGLRDGTLDALDLADLGRDQWSEVLRVAVGPEAPPMLGTHAVVDRALRFTPMFPLDEGRQYQVRFDPGSVPGREGLLDPAIQVMVGRPASTTAPSTIVARVYPSGEFVPENLLRMYVEFSGPMGRRSGVEHITLMDDNQQEIPGAVLPLDYEFWSPDHTRFTVFFDPGRVKTGILPNRQMGRPLEAGRSVTLVISREWRDADGLPLQAAYRRTFRVAPADEQPLDASSWRIVPPAASSRSRVVVTFPKPLDHGLLMRALGVTRDGQALPGDVVVDRQETRWSFTPTDTWRPGTYHLLALDILEDPAGNRIGRAFEVENRDTVDRGPDPESLVIPFSVS